MATGDEVWQESTNQELEKFTNAWFTTIFKRGIQSKCKIYYNKLNHTLTFLNVVQTAPITTQLLLPVTTSTKLVILPHKKIHLLWLFTFSSEKKSHFPAKIKKLKSQTAKVNSTADFAWVSKSNWLCITTLHDWVRKRHVQLCHPIRNENKTSVTRLHIQLHVFTLN